MQKAQDSESESLTDSYDNSRKNESTYGAIDSKKMLQYKQQEINDRYGTYNFEEDPQAYKKARK